MKVKFDCDENVFNEEYLGCVLFDGEENDFIPRIFKTVDEASDYLLKCEHLENMDRFYLCPILDSDAYAMGIEF